MPHMKVKKRNKCKRWLESRKEESGGKANPVFLSCSAPNGSLCVNEDSVLFEI